MVVKSHVLTRRKFVERAACALGMGLAGCEGSSTARKGPVVSEAKQNPAESGAVPPYPFYRAAGTHRELGRQHGEQAAEKIKAHLENMAVSMKLTQEEIRSRALRFQPLWEEHCPHLLEEIDGLAEGAGIAPADALAVNIRGALQQATEGGCTAYVVGPKGTADGEILIGQNSDTLPPVIDFAYVLHLKPPDKPEVLMWTFGGMIGYHGLNSQGVAHFANDLGGGPAPRFAMPHYPLKRLMLECARVDEVLKLFQKIPLCANGNYVLCDGAGRILDVEATTAGPEQVIDNGAGFIAHSNHFICGTYATPENHAQSVADSFPRLDRMNGLIRNKFGDVTVDTVKTFLRDRAGHPFGICRHAQTDDSSAGWQTAGITVASLIAEPALKRLHVAVGNRVETPFVTYEMDR